MNYDLVIDNIRDVPFDLVQSLWELQQKFLESLQNLTVIQTIQELSPILADYCSLRENIFTMTTNMNILKDELIQLKNQQRSSKLLFSRNKQLF